MSARDRLLELLRERSFAKKRVVLASGKESDFFIDCKQSILTAHGHAWSAEVMLAAVRSLGECVAVAGVELGGCPLASAVAMKSVESQPLLDAIYVRKDAKDHGSKRLLEGDTLLYKGARIALLEDVITTGGSTLKAAIKLRDAGYEVIGVVALVDRLEGGREAIEADGLRLISLYTRTDFMTET